MNTDVIRNWLNIIFMIVSMVVKFAEATLRMFKV